METFSRRGPRAVPIHGPVLLPKIERCLRSTRSDCLRFPTGHRKRRGRSRANERVPKRRAGGRPSRSGCSRSDTAGPDVEHRPIPPMTARRIGGEVYTIRGHLRRRRTPESFSWTVGIDLDGGGVDWRPATVGGPRNQRLLDLRLGASHADGHFDLYSRATDNAGNIEPLGAPVQVLIDQDLPTASDDSLRGGPSRRRRRSYRSVMEPCLSMTARETTTSHSTMCTGPTLIGREYAFTSAPHPQGRPAYTDSTGRPTASATTTLSTPWTPEASLAAPWNTARSLLMTMESPDTDPPVGPHELCCDRRRWPGRVGDGNAHPTTTGTWRTSDCTSPLTAVRLGAPIIPTYDNGGFFDVGQGGTDTSVQRGGQRDDIHVPPRHGGQRPQRVDGPDRFKRLRKNGIHFPVVGNHRRRNSLDQRNLPCHRAI